MKFNFKPNTVVLMVGPSNCGKTTFSEWIEYSAERGGLSCKWLSSDDIRRELLSDYKLDKYNPKMNQASHEAFKQLFSRLNSHTRWPINTDIVIVDSTGLDKDFRSRILDIAKQNHYNVDLVMFRFKNKDEYYKYGENEIIRKHVKRLLRETSAEIKTKDFHNKYVLEQRMEDTPITISLEKKKQGKSISGQTWVIGDVHGCYDELIALIEKIGGKVTNKGIEHKDNIVFVGDLIDKGPRQLEVAELVLRSMSNFDNIHCVLGNHENFVYKYNNGLIKHDIQTEVLDKFDSVSSPAMKELIDELYEKSVHYVVGDDFIVTHAPCEGKYLGKETEVGLRSQRNFRHTNMTEDELWDSLAFLKKENTGKPYKIFGHIAFNKPLKFGNVLGIDTGAVHGGFLTAVCMSEKRPYIVKVKSEKYYDGDVVNLRHDTKIDIKALERKEFGRIMYMARNKINFISGTVCPADKMGDELESLEWALEYYRSRDINKVVLQRKYMGSRCQAYIFKNKEESYGVTRNGNIINWMELPCLSSIELPDNVKLRILDCELMPWSLLGEDLINRDFYGYWWLANKKREMANNAGFPECHSRVMSAYVKDFDSMTKQEFIKKYGHHIYQLCKMTPLIRKEFFEYEVEPEHLSKFKTQVDLYGQPKEQELKPFLILKDVYEDGTEKVRVGESNYDNWKEINDDDILLIDTNKPTAYEHAHSYFESLTTTEGFEGVVVKPEFIKEGVAPYIKVRNPEYLRIVYGHDYLREDKLKKLMDRKRINGKMSKSIRDFQNGIALLNQSYDSLSEDNQDYLQCLARFVAEKTGEIDPRF